MKKIDLYKKQIVLFKKTKMTLKPRKLFLEQNWIILMIQLTTECFFWEEDENLTHFLNNYYFQR